MNNNTNDETAFTVLPAGTTGPEALEGAPEELEYFLQNFINNGHHIRRLESYGLPASVFQTVEHVGKEAYAIVEDGHVHVGLVHEDAANTIGPIFEATTLVEVCTEYGGIWIRTPLLPPSRPLITVAMEQMVWRSEDGTRCAVTHASLYVLRKGRMVKLCTKRTRSHSLRD